MFLGRLPWLPALVLVAHVRDWRLFVTNGLVVDPVREAEECGDDDPGDGQDEDGLDDEGLAAVEEGVEGASRRHDLEDLGSGNGRGYCVISGTGSGRKGKTFRVTSNKFISGDFEKLVDWISSYLVCLYPIV